MNEKILLSAKVNNDDIEGIIKNANIQYPHESLGFFKAVYASIDNKANKNGVRLASSVKGQIPQLVGTQTNFEHQRVGSICGTILYAFVNKTDEIEIVFSFYKTVYPNEYEYAMELLDAGELNVSFELKVDKADIEYLPDGTRSLKKVSFDGVGLLMENQPAYPNAHVYQHATIDELREQDLVFASHFGGEKMIQQFEGSHWSAKYINALPDTCFAVIEPSYFNGETNDKRARHLPYKDYEGNVNSGHYRYALRQIDKLSPVTDSITKLELVSIAQNVLNNVDISFNKEDTVDKKANDALLETLKADVLAEFGEEAVKDWKDEDYTDEKITAYRESLKTAKEDADAQAKIDADAVKAEEDADAQAKVDADAVKAEDETYDCECLDCGKVIQSNDHCKDVKCPECGGEMRREDKPGVGASVEKTEEEKAEMTEKTTESRVYNVVYKDDGSMEIEETSNVEVEVDGEKVLQEKVVRQTVYAQEVIDGYEAQISEKDEKIASYQAQVVAELKAELGDYVKDYSDEDLADEDKLKIARLTKEKDELIAKIKQEPTVKAEVVEDVVATVKTDDAPLETGSTGEKDDDKVDIDAFIKDKQAKALRKVRKAKKA